MNDSPLARWAVLVLVALMMFFAYMFVDVMSPLKSLVESDLGWNSSVFGKYAASEYILNVGGFLMGASEAFNSWFGLPRYAGILLFYVIGAGVVFAGMKIVGVCEKIAVFFLIAVVGVLFVATLRHGTRPLTTEFQNGKSILALFGIISFSLSAVMSTPQVVKGLEGDVKRIRGAIATGIGVNCGLIFFVTITTLLGVGSDITNRGALVDLSETLGGWVGVIGYIFTLFALATSFWANTLNLRDIVHEQTKWNLHVSWLAATLPCLVIALLGFASFVGFTLYASAIQVVTGVGIIWAYHLSRKRVGAAPIIGRFGTLPFQILVVLLSLSATIGALIGAKL